MDNSLYFCSTEIAPRSWQIGYAFAQGIHPVYAYLLEGDNYALAIDTMDGYGNLYEYMRTLTSKPIKLVVTHAHPDHTGGCYDFNECYISPLDMPYFYSETPRTAHDMYQHALDCARPELRDLIQEQDFKAECAMRTYPVWDGDIFDLGGRLIEVIEVGGHTPGSVALLDSEQRLLYSGDACNSNTLMIFENSLSIEDYMQNLIDLKRRMDEFDNMYGGHQVLPPETIDEAIELCARVLAGTDDKAEYPSMLGMVPYAAKRVKPNGIERVDGKHFNMCYRPDNLLSAGYEPQIIR